MPGSFSSRLPQRSSSMLLTMTSTRSTRSPLSYILRVSLPKCTLNTVKSYTDRSMIFSNRPSRAWVLLGRCLRPKMVLSRGTSNSSARAVNQPLIDFIQLPPAFEQQIAAVFQLVARIGVAKPRTFLLLAS